jgi:glutathione S-transferase
MAKKIKLTYFDGRGRGEVARQILAYSGQPWEDDRISFAEWPELKPKTPLGTLPVLEYDGKKFSQSVTVCRFLANEVGIAGKTNCEKAMADMIVDTIVDVQIECFKNAFEKDPIENKKQKEKLEKETFPSLLKKLLAIHQQSPGAYMVGNDLTWADIFLAAFLDQWLAMYHVDGISRFSLLTDLKNKVNECPKIKAYLAQRKETPF